MTREYHKWHSPALDREMELLVFGHAGPQVLVFPTRKQRFFEYEDHGMIHAVRRTLAEGKLQLICIDSIDGESLYCFDKSPDSRIQRHLAYERYIMSEVLPFSAKLNPRATLTAHGCSFGAYHAMTIALRHPDRFARVVAFSGRYDLTLDAGDFHTLFHGYYDDALLEITPSHFLPKLTDARLLKKIRELRFTLVCGEDDPFFINNQELAATFTAKKIKHEFHAWVGNAHRFRYWRQMLRIYL
jgi:esterase/lipase superfamily enzyme